MQSFFCIYILFLLPLKLTITHSLRVIAMDKIFKIKNTGQFDVNEIYNAILDFINLRFPQIFEEDDTDVIPLPMEEGAFEDQNIRFIITPISTTGVILKHYKRNIIELILPEYASMGDCTLVSGILEYLMHNFSKQYFKAGYNSDTCGDRGFVALLEHIERNANNLLQSEKYLKGEIIPLNGYACMFFLSSDLIDSYNGDPTLDNCEKFWNTFGQIQYDYLKCTEVDIQTDTRIEGTFCPAYNVENVFMPPTENIVLVKGNDCKVIPRDDIQKLRGRYESAFRYIYFPDSLHTIVRKMPEDEYESLYDALPYPEIENFRRIHIIRWNPAISNIKRDEYLDWMDSFEAPDFWISWSFWDYKDVNIGDYVFMEVVGQQHKGIIMSGTIVEDPEKDDDWSGKGREVYYAKFHVTAMTDPDVPTTILSTDILEKEIPDFNWEKGHSGELLSDEDGRKLIELWDDHLADLKATAIKSIGNEVDDPILENVRIRGWQKPKLNYDNVLSIAYFLNKDSLDPEVLSVPVPENARLVSRRRFGVYSAEDEQPHITDTDIYSIGNDFKLNFVFAPEVKCTLMIYPEVKGSPCGLTIERVAVWPGMSVATIFAKTDSGDEINFFSSDYYDNKKMYVSGRRLTVELGGVMMPSEVGKSAVPPFFAKLDITRPDIYVVSGILESQKSFKFQNNDCKLLEISIPPMLGTTPLPVYAPAMILPPLRKGNNIDCSIQLVGRIYNR